MIPGIVVVLTLTHRYNAVGGYRTDSQKLWSGKLTQEEKIKQNIKLLMVHTITETNRIPQARIKR